MKKYTQYKATLRGEDGFERIMIIKYPLPQIFIPKLEKINVFLEEPTITSNPVTEKRTFLLNRDLSFKNKLFYQEMIV